MSALGDWEVPGQLDMLTEARVARDDSIALVEDAAETWQRDAVDRLIRGFAATGDPFSANAVRPLLPDGIRPALLGARFLAASRRGVIRKVGYVPSTDRATHAHPVALWVGM